ncbi:respiratory nitrate reductase subunit gamma [Prauserella flavalba]|uniref:respiratory nitrate reductase subunit gamma n=1 Tax=Prauserella flavalba TaxID=1477506 RepID=UPI00143D15F6|nr:respiratory nitrate reductase subunit gamma [Prauserella flavalba]
MLVLATIGFAVNFWAWALLSPLGYRQTVSPWFRSIFSLQPKPELMAAAPWGFRAHALGAWLLFAFWPFSRLVHVFSVPLGYLTRPYIVYRSRDERLGSREPRRGWEPVQ